jgi:hypothetical protein
MAYHMHSLLRSRKAQFFVLSAFAIVTVIYFISRWIEPYTIIDTSAVVLMEEPFIFNNIVEKANETVYISRSPEELRYNIEEYKQFVEEYALRKNLKITFDISNLSFGNTTAGSIFIQLSSPRMTINRTLLVSRSF